MTVVVNVGCRGTRGQIVMFLPRVSASAGFRNGTSQPCRALFFVFSSFTFIHSDIGVSIACKDLPTFT